METRVRGEVLVSRRNRFASTSHLGWRFGLVVIALTLTLTACGSGTSSTTTEATTPPTSAPATTTASTASTTTTATTVAQTTTTTAVPTRIVIVDSTADSGPGTLRQALIAPQSGDAIRFDPSVFPPDAPASIVVAGPLPQIMVSGLTIDASEAGVIVDGREVDRNDFVTGLEILSDSNTVRGIHLRNFPGGGVVIAGGRDNLIGGDPTVGSGPSGQGIVSGGNQLGIALWGPASGNRIVGNLVGVTVSGEPIPNDVGVSLSEQASGNTIGRANLITNNAGCGVEVIGSDAVANTITENSIYGNAGSAICLAEGGNEELIPPYFADYDGAAGQVIGFGCPGCRVEVFAATTESISYLAGDEVASDGSFTVAIGEAFLNSAVVATVTDAAGNTSRYSRPGGRRTFAPDGMQLGNSEPAFLLLPRRVGQLPPDSRIGLTFVNLTFAGDGIEDARHVADILDYGAMRVDISLNEVEPPIDYAATELVFPPEFDALIDTLNERDVAVNYLLQFWDKEGAGPDIAVPRFQTRDQIDDFIEYVRMIVERFAGRMQYYTIWSEPDNCGQGGVKCVPPATYVELVRELIPMIRSIDPATKISVSPHVLYYAENELYEVMESGVIDMFDVVQWHGIYDTTPNSAQFGDYYRDYPTIIEDIRTTANANGFDGEFWGTDVTYFAVGDLVEGGWEPVPTPVHSAKYGMRFFVKHLGVDMGTSVTGYNPQWRYYNTIFAASRPTALDVTIDTSATDVVAYAFESHDGDVLYALWRDGAAAAADPGTPATLTISGLAGQNAEAIDALRVVKQGLLTESNGSDLIIRDLLIFDYPIIIRFG